VDDGRSVRILIARGTSPAAQELAEAICRGASRFAEVRIRAVGDVAAQDLALCDVVVLAAPPDRRRGAMAQLLGALPSPGPRIVLVTERSPRRLLARGRASSLTRLLRRRSVALLMPRRTFRLDARGLLLGDQWERARELGEDVVVAAGGTVRLERLLPDAA
jgi:hypothetical protein